MSDYRTVYRCRMCGEILRGPVIDIGSYYIVDAIEKMAYAQQFRANPYLAKDIPPMTILHHCKNGWDGIADFAGFKEEENE